MAEFEASRAVPVPPDRLFAAASDVDRMASWVPTADRARGTQPGVVRLSGRDWEFDALWRAEPEQRRIEWSPRGGGDYAGWLQVAAAGERDEHSEATIHLSFLGDRPEAHGGDVARDVQAELERALDDLARLVTE